MKKTLKELECELKTNRIIDEERDISDKAYARKELEKFVIWFFALLVAGAVGLAVTGWINK
jgi:hypothetical protein